MVKTNRNTKRSFAPSEYIGALVSAEFAIKKRWPIYSGGLGVLAGDQIKQAADDGYPIVGLGMAYHKGYFTQALDETGWQHEEAVNFILENEFERLDQIVNVNISGRTVKVGAYRYFVKGERADLPLYLLTTNLPENSEWDRELTARLYDQGDNKHYFKTAQFRILGAGVRLLQEFGYNIPTYHLNDGHGAFVALELKNQGLSDERIREKIWFTTHTIVPAAIDHFDIKQVEYALPNEFKQLVPYLVDGQFGTVEFAIQMSRGINAVSPRQANICKGMDIFMGRSPIPIANGVHLPTWLNHGKANVYAKYLSENNLQGLYRNPQKFMNSHLIDYESFMAAHKYAQKDLFDMVRGRTGINFELGALTIGFARRSAEYKRGDLIFQDLSELARIMKKYSIQLIFAGKAHPNDTKGKEIIKSIWQSCKTLREEHNVNAVFLPNYGMESAKYLMGGIDVLLNNPKRPEEASGTSGMKAALNGVINLSVLDGWWWEAYNGKNGWAIAPDNNSNDYELDAAEIRNLLEHKIIPIMRSSKERKEITMESLKLAAYYNTSRNLRGLIRSVYNKHPIPLESIVEKEIRVA